MAHSLNLGQLLLHANFKPCEMDTLSYGVTKREDTSLGTTGGMGTNVSKIDDFLGIFPGSSQEFWESRIFKLANGMFSVFSRGGRCVS